VGLVVRNYFRFGFWPHERKNSTHGTMGESLCRPYPPHEKLAFSYFRKKKNIAILHSIGKST
jgi:hypothetical protein